MTDIVSDKMSKVLDDALVASLDVSSAGEIQSLRQRVERLEGALREAEEVLNLANGRSFPDPSIASEVRYLGEKAGFGNLMATASSIWAGRAESSGIGGSEFVAGPCRATVEKALAMIRAALSPKVQEGE